MSELNWPPFRNYAMGPRHEKILKEYNELDGVQTSGFHMDYRLRPKHLHQCGYESYMAQAIETNWEMLSL